GPPAFPNRENAGSAQSCAPCPAGADPPPTTGLRQHTVLWRQHRRAGANPENRVAIFPRTLPGNDNSRSAFLDDSAVLLSKKTRHTFPQHQHAILHSGGGSFVGEQALGFIHGLMREAETAVVHGHHPSRP